MFETGYIEQSAVIPYRINKGKVEILVITSRKNKRWVIPKGIIEPDMTPVESAQEEAKEEAGVTGTAYPDLLGTYKYKKWGGTCRVKVYLLKVENLMHTWLEDFRKREWVNVDEAAARVKEKALKSIIKKSPAYIK